MKTSRKTCFARVFLALAMVVSLMPSAALAADEPATVADTSAIYVSSTGDDSTGDGTQENPYATITKAYSTVATGGTIYLLSDLTIDGEYSASAVNFNLDKNVTITSSGEKKTITSSCGLYVRNALFYVTKGSVTFTDIVLDGSGQTCRNQTKSENRYCGAIYVDSGAATIGSGTTIQNFNYGKDCRGGNGSAYGGNAVLYSKAGSAQINILDGALITDCKIEGGAPDNPAAVVLCGSGGTVYMTGGSVTGNTLQTDDTSSVGPYNAIVCAGMFNNPHFWMTDGVVTGNNIGTGGAAVYMRGEASQCDIQFGNNAYVYDNYVSGTSGDQRNIYLKNKKTDGTENSNIYVKLCSALTDESKLGVYAEMIGIASKVAQGSGINSVPYTATAKDTTYFISDKETDAEILYCGGDEDTCGLLAHRDDDTNHNNGVEAIYLSVSPGVTATKNTTNDDQLDISITRCTSDTTYVVLDKDLKPVTGKTLTSGEYNTDGNTFKLTDSATTTTIGMLGLDKDSGPYTVMIVGDGGLSVDSTTGKADTSNLTDIATVNVVNFVGENVSWTDGTSTFANGDFDIVTVPHNDQTGTANKTYTATAATGYALAAKDPVSASGNLGEATITDATGGGKTIAVEVPAYGTTTKGTTNYSTVTLTGTAALNTDVVLLTTADGEEMTDGKTYDGAAVAHTTATMDGATLTYTWQKVTTSGETTTYTDLTTAPSDAGDYNLKITAKSTSDASKVLGTQNLPFTINKKTVTVSATANDKTYDGATTATLKSASLSGVVDSDKNAVSLVNSKITLAFEDKNAGDSKAVTATVADGALSGDKAGNYTIGSLTAQNAKISPRTLTATITATTKTYDGLADATVSTPTLSDVVDGETVTATVSNAKFADANAGTDKTVTATITLDSSDAAKNYTVSDTASTTASITPKTLTVTATVENKAYDGKTDATVSNVTLTGVETGDSVTLNESGMSAAFDDENVGDGKTVTISGLTLNNNDDGNYKLPETITTTANITKADGSGEVEINGWTYGDTPNSPSASSTTNPETDTEKITYLYKAKDAPDTDYSTTVPTDAGEYIVKATFPGNDNYNETTATTNFTIAAKALTVNVTAQDKTYDGKADATLNAATLDGVVDGDTDKVALVTDAVSASFDDKNAGVGKTVTLTGNYTLTGDAAKNYTVTQPTGLTADVTAKTLTVTATAKNKPYDGKTDATVSNVTLTGVEAGDSVTLNESGMSAAFDDANVGGDKTVTISGLTLNNNDDGNYKLPETITTTANITKADGSGEVEINGWTYGDTPNSPSASSTTNPETDTEKITYLYKAKDAPDTDYSTTVPTDAGEYIVKATFPGNDNYNETTATTNFTIAAKALTVNVTAQDKTYDGKADATLNAATLDGVVDGDTDKVALVTDAVSASFDDKNAGVGKTVTLTGNYTLTGDTAKNYTVTQPTGLTADVTPAPLTITGATVKSKKYDGTDDATITAVEFSGLLGGDTLAFGEDYTVSNAKYDGKNATGEGAATKVDFDVALTDTTLAKNYKLTTEKGTQGSQTIEKADITDKTASTSGVAGQENTFDIPEGYIVDGANLASITVTQNDNSILAREPSYADNKLTYILNDTAENGQSATARLKFSSQNYEIYYIDITIGVDNRQEVAITIDDAALTYNAEPQAPTNVTVEDNLVPTSELVVTYVGTGSTVYPESNIAPTGAGTYSMSVSVPDSNTKYKGSATKAFTIAPKQISATLIAENKTYDGNKNAKVTATINGVVGDDDVTVVVSNPVFEDKNVGENKKVTATVTLEGADVANYQLESDTVETTANITQAPVVDKTAPVIKGAVDGKTYCAALTLTITDENLDSVTVNGKTAALSNGKLTLNPADGTQTVIATDKSGNSTSITVTVNNGHTWGEWTSVGDGKYHKRSCKFDSTATETAECTGGVATCKNKAVCEVCKGSYGELDPNNHADLKHVEAKSATTTAEGNIEYWYCEDCDKYYKDADATKEIAEADTVIAKLDADSGSDISDETEDASGTVTAFTTEVASALDTSVKTGDTTPMIFWMALFFVSGGALAVTTLASRKKQQII